LWLLRPTIANRLAFCHAGRDRHQPQSPAANFSERGKRVMLPTEVPGQASTATRSVLVIEDDPDIAESLRYSLERERIATRVALTGEEGLAAALDSTNPPALILLDLLLPGLNGFEICRRLRREPATLLIPIIMLTARASPAEIATGLAAGADDYMTKPFSVREVVARIDTFLRPTDQTTREVYDDGTIRFDFTELRVFCNGVATRLSTLEFVLLVELLANAGVLATRQQLIDKLWSAGHYRGARTLDDYIQRLRSILNGATGTIETEAGVGYRFVAAGKNAPTGDCEKAS
jgi:DNA-binding response OmpR family regulator